MHLFCLCRDLARAPLGKIIRALAPHLHPGMATDCLCGLTRLLSWIPCSRPPCYPQIGPNLSVPRSSCGDLALAHGM